MIKFKIYECVVEILGLSGIKSLYPSGFQKEWHMEFSFGGRGKGEKNVFEFCLCSVA